MVIKSPSVENAMFSEAPLRYRGPSLVGNRKAARTERHWPALLYQARECEQRAHKFSPIVFSMPKDTARCDCEPVLELCQALESMGQT